MYWKRCGRFLPRRKPRGSSATEILNAESQYDIVVYDEIPWYLRGEILEHHRVVYAEDPDNLDFWLYKQRRIWQDMKRRQQSASLDDLLTRAGR